MVPEEVIQDILENLESIIKKVKKEYDIEKEINPSEGLDPKVLVYGLRCAINALNTALRDSKKLKLILIHN